MPDLITCPICQTKFNPANLEQVLEHIHGVEPEIIELAKGIKGKRVVEKRKQTPKRNNKGPLTEEEKSLVNLISTAIVNMTFEPKNR